ncbi:MAG: hypothetical protein WAS27_02825 [Candidatus Saccharimonadales bacterium]
MKVPTTQLIREITADRRFLAALFFLVLLGVIFCLFIAFTIRPVETQVVTHYTAFGQTNFYRDKWYYLISFVGFGIVTVVIYAALACKLYKHKGRELAVPFAWLGVVTLVIATATVSQVLKVAALS